MAFMDAYRKRVLTMEQELDKRAIREQSLKEKKEALELDIKLLKSELKAKEEMLKDINIAIIRKGEVE
ncbi:hypothetical protein FC756_25315 [Lysinibacillus mangiferihumi]|uniref:Uncharacterized protein n=1 Tax=Lysinibacillus mangiferihumi TaxID=1130819 RepID=A0A4U2XZW5_9BACI|nr:hypothetical protein [Lysinibacillus mangiferihumi]TKI53194.1 hypothetical protein FC756_25315 [Lysinibacillus mangiferihumi]